MSTYRRKKRTFTWMSAGASLRGSESWYAGAATGVARDLASMLPLGPFRSRKLHLVSDLLTPARFNGSGRQPRFPKDKTQNI